LRLDAYSDAYASSHPDPDTYSSTDAHSDAGPDPDAHTGSDTHSDACAHSYSDAGDSHADYWLGFLRERKPDL